MKPSPRVQIITILCCLVSAASGLAIVGTNSTQVEVEKNHDKLGAEYKMKKSLSSISISCHLKDTAPLKSPIINWQRLDRRPSAKLEITSTISSDLLSFTSKLTIEHPQNRNISAYVCSGQASGKNASAIAAFVSVPLLDIGVDGGGVSALPSSVPPDLLAYPGLALTLTCETFGYPVGTSKWFRESDQGKESQVGNGSKLVLASLNYKTDRSHYVCRSSNELGSNSLRIFLRVKSPTAYLAPLIALIVQVVIVIVIIIAYELVQYEKRQKRARDMADGNKSQ